MVLNLKELVLDQDSYYGFENLYYQEIDEILERIKKHDYKSCSLIFRMEDELGTLNDHDVLSLLNYSGDTKIRSTSTQVFIDIKRHEGERVLTYSFVEFGVPFKLRPQEWDTIFVEKLGCEYGVKQLADIIDKRSKVKKLILREDRSEAELQWYLINKALPKREITIGTLERTFRRSHISSLLPGPAEAVKTVDVQRSPLVNVIDANPGISIKRRGMPWTIKRYKSFSPKFYKHMRDHVAIYLRYSRERDLPVVADTILAMFEHAVQEEDRERKRRSEEQQEEQERKRPAILF